MVCLAQLMELYLVMVLLVTCTGGPLLTLFFETLEQTTL